MDVFCCFLVMILLLYLCFRAFRILTMSQVNMVDEVMSGSVLVPIHRICFSVVAYLSHSFYTKPKRERE